MGIKKQVYEIDSSGYIKEIYVENPETTQHITIDPPNGLYRAKWTGEEWVEDMTQEEIDALSNQPQPLSTEDRIAMAEQAINVLIMMGGM